MNPKEHIPTARTFGPFGGGKVRVAAGNERSSSIKQKQLYPRTTAGATTMKAPTLAVVLCAAGASAFVGTPVVQPKACATTRGHSSSQPVSQQQESIDT